MEAREEDLVQVAVPRSRLLDVYALLAEPASARATAVAHHAPWDQEGVARLWKGSEATAKKLMQTLAAQPGIEVPLDEVKEAIGSKGGRGVGGAVGALRRRCRNHLGRDLPFEKHWDATNGTRYLMTHEIAALVAEHVREDR